MKYLNNMGMQINNHNWYKTAIALEEMQREAGVGKNFMVGVYAAALIFMGWAASTVSQKTNLSESEINQAVNDPSVASKAKALADSKEINEIMKDIEFYRETEKLYNMQKQLAEMNGQPNQNQNQPQQSVQQKNKPQSSIADYVATAKDLIIQHEGVRRKVYKDSRGVPTIGIGFNLKRPDAPTLLKSLGLSYKKVLSGKQTLSDYQIGYLFTVSFEKAKQDASAIVSSFDSQPAEAKAVLLDMSFNMGDRLAGFTDFIQALEDQDYTKATKEMVDSNWYKQVGIRGRTLVGMMKNLALREQAKAEAQNTAKRV